MSAEKTELINGQGLEPYKNMRYGRSTVGKAGCEAIASYNALRLLGREVLFPDVAAQYIRLFRNPLRGWGMGGAFGAAPRDIAAFLRRNGVAFTSARRLKTLLRRLKPGVMIVSFWNRPFTAGYHTVAVEYDGRVFTAYNVTNTGRAPRREEDFTALLPGRRRLIRCFFLDGE